ncbi:MAG: hypothetical protein AAGI07_15880 [Bacteroidota bacterium]
MQSIEEKIVATALAVKVIGNCYSLEDAIEVVKMLKPQFVLHDLDMRSYKLTNTITVLTIYNTQVIALTRNEQLFRELKKQRITVIILTGIYLDEIIEVIKDKIEKH